VRSKLANLSSRLAASRLCHQLGLRFLLVLAGALPLISFEASLLSSASGQTNPPIQKPSAEALSYPPGTTAWLLQYLAALAAGLSLLVLWNGALNRRRESHSVTSLAKEAYKLKRLTIGYPDGMRIFEELRRQELLEDRFRGLGLAVEWRTYPSASSLLNDLSNGWIDFCGGGATASIFSQSAHHLFVRLGREKYPDLDSDLILVPEDSTIQSIADLRGKRIAFDEGSSAHYLLVRCLESAGIAYAQFEPVMLAQQDALPLFREGLIDAWVVWMPYAPTRERRSYPGRSLGSLESILGQDVARDIPTLYYGIPELVRDYPRILKAILEEVNEAGVISLERRLMDLQAMIADEDPSKPDYQHLSSSIQQLHGRIQERTLVPLDELTLQHLQEQANRFCRLGLIKDKVNVGDLSYNLRARQNWTY
jgi:sulfonate transport system substrate-binding protein